PALDVSLTGPADAVAGDDLAWQIGLANRGSAPAHALTVDSTVDHTPHPVHDVPTDLPAGGLATGSLSATVPADHPGGDLDAAVTLAWSDTAGNTYGPIEVQATTTIGTAAHLRARLADHL